MGRGLWIDVCDEGIATGEEQRRRVDERERSGDNWIGDYLRAPPFGTLVRLLYLEKPLLWHRLCGQCLHSVEAQ